MHPTITNIGAYVKTVGASSAIQGVAPAAKSAGTSYGPAITLEGAKSLVLTGLTGAATGSPTSYDVVYSLQVATENTFAAPTDVSGTTITLTADNTAGEVDFNLMSLAAGNLFARVKVVVSFSGGTTPTALCAAQVTLGGYQVLPA